MDSGSSLAVSSLLIPEEIRYDYKPNESTRRKCKESWLMPWKKSLAYKISLLDVEDIGTAGDIRLIRV